MNILMFKVYKMSLDTSVLSLIGCCLDAIDTTRSINQPASIPITRRREGILQDMKVVPFLICDRYVPYHFQSRIGEQKRAKESKREHERHLKNEVR